MGRVIFFLFTFTAVSCGPAEYGLDGMGCDAADWVADAEPNPILETTQGKVRGRHRCKLNRRYADPAVTDGMGPKQFEGDSFYHIPYAKHTRRFDYGHWISNIF